MVFDHGSNVVEFVFYDICLNCEGKLTSSGLMNLSTAGSYSRGNRWQNFLFLFRCPLTSCRPTPSVHIMSPTSVCLFWKDISLNNIHLRCIWYLVRKYLVLWFGWTDPLMSIWRVNKSGHPCMCVCSQSSNLSVQNCVNVPLRLSRELLWNRCEHRCFTTAVMDLLLHHSKNTKYSFSLKVKTWSWAERLTAGILVSHHPSDQPEALIWQQMLQFANKRPWRRRRSVS